MGLDIICKLQFFMKGCLFLDHHLLQHPEDPVKTPHQERRQEPAEISESTKYFNPDIPGCYK